MQWNRMVDVIAPHVFKIESPSGHGTGFLCLMGKDHEMVGIATALHVVQQADKWQQPIRVSNYQTQDTRLLTTTDRVILSSGPRDSAVILFGPGDLHLPEKLIPLVPDDVFLTVGCEVGWVGFPAVEPNTLCFFCGYISASILDNTAYLVDGVAINGVSGGPVFSYQFSTGADGKRFPDPEIIGLTTAYIPNRATGEPLPGLAVAQDVSHIHEVISRLASLQEAQEKKSQLEREMQKPPDGPDGGVLSEVAPA
jgi:hypothetical protein